LTGSKTRTENLDDLAVHLEAIGNVDDVAEDLRHSLGHRRLAVAGRAVKQDAAAGIDRRTDVVDEVAGDHQALESGLHLLTGDLLAADLLLQNLPRIGVQTNRRRADVGANLQGFRRPLLAEAGQGVTQFAGEPTVGALRLHQLVLDAFVDQGLHHPRLQLQEPHQVLHLLDFQGEHRLEHEFAQLAGGDAHLFQGFRRARRLGHHAGQLFFRDQPQRHQAVAETAAGALLQLDRLLDLRLGRQILLKKDLPQIHRQKNSVSPAAQRRGPLARLAAIPPPDRNNAAAGSNLTGLS